ncbi:hypothetical protein ABHI18_004201 [Aspergillus niger]
MGQRLVVSDLGRARDSRGLYGRAVVVLTQVKAMMFSHYRCLWRTCIVPTKQLILIKGALAIVEIVA